MRAVCCDVTSAMDWESGKGLEVCITKPEAMLAVDARKPSALEEPWIQRPDSLKHSGLGTELEGSRAWEEDYCRGFTMGSTRALSQPGLSSLLPCPRVQLTKM